MSCLLYPASNYRSPKGNCVFHGEARKVSHQKKKRILYTFKPVLSTSKIQKKLHPYFNIQKSHYITTRVNFEKYELQR